jgi:RNA polymerase sigma factor (sigma-70 family)
MTDQELIAGLAKRDKAAIGFIYREIRPYLFLQLTKWGASEAEAEDIFHDAMYAELLVRPQETLVLHSATYKTYLRSICCNIYLKACRIKKRLVSVTNQEVVVPAIEAQVENQLNTVELKSIIDRAKAKLSESCSGILHKSITLGLPFAQIAEQLGISYANARQRAHRCRTRLRKLIEEDPTFEAFIKK